MRDRSGKPKRRIQRVSLTNDTSARKIPVEVPVHGFSWESYHSKFNEAGGVTFPTPSICDLLQLRRLDGAFDFVDRSGRVGATYRVLKNPNGRANFLFLREDLLRQYLDSTKTTLAWLLWGERRFQHEYERKNEKLIRDRGCYENHNFIHRGAVAWCPEPLSYL